jgi:predicted acetyltransferase
MPPSPLRPAELTVPTTRLRGSWLEARQEWAPGDTMHGSGLGDTDIDTVDGFDAWVRHLVRQADESIPVEADRVHATYWWIVDDHDTYLGAISLRHRLNDFLLRAGGHIGYSLRPSARGRGIAAWALAEVLPHARARGLDRVLLTCRDDNLASARTIERNGGVLEDVRETELGPTRRYWIDLRQQIV